MTCGAKWHIDSDGSENRERNHLDNNNDDDDNKNSDDDDNNRSDDDDDDHGVIAS